MERDASPLDNIQWKLNQFDQSCVIWKKKDNNEQNIKHNNIENNSRREFIVMHMVMEHMGVVQ
jgi:hypothetical protein